ncbi:ORF 73; extensive acidic domains, potential leucine zipper; immediate early protein homolog [hydrothermal vent metagenome]|uniref:ORF 73 extensive acidic domains, potential leucine zipper immediate early protein homolog n=1 Tax=hydrothermal vent metagenome TaxID=652676 RepID=A0A1W1EAS0_9ZZZZ
MHAEEEKKMQKNVAEETISVEEVQQPERTETSSKEMSDEQSEPQTQEAVSKEESISDKTLGDSEVLAEIDGMKKSDAAMMLIEKTKHIVNDAEKQMEACKLLLEEDLKGYHEAKTALESEALHESEELLNVLGFENKNEEESEKEEVVVFERKEELPPFVVQEVSSGKFTGFLMALITGGTAFAGMVYLASQKVGITLDVTKVPTMDTLKEVLGWYATLFGGKPNFVLGGTFVAAVTLLVMWIVYAIRVSNKASSNLAFAKTQLSEAEAYIKQKGSCKEEMDKVDAHIQDAIETMKSFQVLLHEQNAKLKRIMHIEGHKENDKYHDKSREEMRSTRVLIDAIKEFMETPMSEEGKLSGKSTLFLHSAKSKLQKIIDRLY